MTSQTRYLLDANVFIEANRRYYAFPICPGFWAALVSHHGSGSVWSIDRVKDELVDSKDELSNWVRDDVPPAAFLSTNDSVVVARYAEVIGWAMAQPQFLAAAKAEFADAKDADAWLVAYASVNGLTLVTHETLDEQIRRKVKLPNACREFGVPYLNTFDMLKDLACQFVWDCA